MLIEPLFVQQIVDMYSAGKSQKEIVEATGQTYCVVRYWLKKKSLYDPSRRCTNRASAMRGVQEYNKKRQVNAENEIEALISMCGFYYVGGYRGKGSAITIRCPHCLKTFERTFDSWLKKRLMSYAKAEAISCPHCAAEAKRKEEEKRRYKELAKKHDQEVRKKRQELKTQKRLNEKHVCKECGCEFTLIDYARRERKNIKNMSMTVYCSSKCRKTHESRSRKKYNLTHGKHSKRCIKYGVEFDKTVNLEELISKVGMRCALCGGFCDKTDYNVVNGAYIFGDNYPSIDHIIPLSKGIKGHTWDNVQIAHRGCNTKKGTNVAV